MDKTRFDSFNTPTDHEKEENELSVKKIYYGWLVSFIVIFVSRLNTYNVSSNNSAHIEYHVLWAYAIFDSVYYLYYCQGLEHVGFFTCSMANHFHDN